MTDEPPAEPPITRQDLERAKREASRSAQRSCIYLVILAAVIYGVLLIMAQSQEAQDAWEKRNRELETEQGR